MEQSSLNRAPINDWYSDGLYEEKFRLRLTSKHQLVVGKWEVGGEWGVDLRRWSYHQARLLAKGITVNSDAWQSLYGTILSLCDQDVFDKYGAINEEEYRKRVKIDHRFSLVTDLFDNGRDPYFCVGLRDGGKVVWTKGIIIRFDTMSDFLAKAQTTGLAPKARGKRGRRRIDPDSGKEIF